MGQRRQIPVVKFTTFQKRHILHDYFQVLRSSNNTLQVQMQLELIVTFKIKFFRSENRKTIYKYGVF